MSKAKNRLRLTDEGGGVWTYEIRAADAQMHLSGLEMMREFRKEIDHIIQQMEKNG
jgi:hypothetical protein